MERKLNCDTCGRLFRRKDHLRRHEQSHSNKKSHACVFCQLQFSRSETLNKHYSQCNSRRGRSPPKNVQGRPKYACRRCFSVKIRCDDNTPCTPCWKKGEDCIRTADPDAQNNEISENRNLDRITIASLLNGGVDNFMRSFNFPKPAPPEVVERAVARNSGAKQPLNDFTGDSIWDIRNELPNIESFNWWLAEEGVAGHFANPFGVPQAEYNMLKGFEPVAIDRSILQPSSVTGLALETTTSSDMTSSMQLINEIVSWISALTQDEEVQRKADNDLHLILDGDGMQRAELLYFDQWHCNARIIHRPSFNLDNTPWRLVIIVYIMGALYDADEAVVGAAHRLLDHIESYLFGADIFHTTSSLWKCPIGGNSNVELDWYRFQEFQAAIIMIVVQHWSGSEAARSRALDVRFGQVVELCRRTHLNTVSHEGEEDVNEQAWLRTEAQIRTMNLVALMDCAFLLFRNLGTRLQLAELRFDLPSEDAEFDSAHPFIPSRSSAARRVCVLQAFHALFERQNHRNHSSDAQIEYESQQSLKLNLFDMFVLVHLLYVSLHNHLVMCTFTFHKDDQRGYCSPRDYSTESSVDDQMIAAISGAFDKWLTIWMNLRRKLDEDEWNSLGFWRNAVKYWQVGRLLLMRRPEIKLGLLMEPCDDKLLMMREAFFHDAEE